MNIEIAKVKEWREQIDATHLVVFAVGRDGSQHVATHGESEMDANTAAKAGNKLKAFLGWPEDLCCDKPLRRVCENCTWYKPDWGLHCMNGWTGDGKDGHCLYLAHNRVATKAEDKCADFEPKV